MLRLKHILSTVLMVLVLLSAACSKSVEGESNKWAANQTTVTTLAAQYPGFKDALEARKQSAQKIFDEAANLDGEAKIEKLSAANSTLMNGFVGDLNRIDSKLKKLRESRVEAASKAGDASGRLGAKVAAEDAQKTVDRVDKLLKQGAKDEASANAILKKALSDIKTAQSAIDKVTKVQKEKADKKEADKKAATDAKAKEKSDADAKTAPWTCEYCKSSNAHTETKCKSCGAPRPAAKK